jgi:hypothetical protein
MVLRKKTLLVCGLASFCGASSSAAFVQGDGLELLNSLDRGMWQLRGIGGTPSKAAASKICLGETARLIQIQHGEATCSRFIVRNSANTLTVSYSCKGLGQGLTTIRKESSKLIQIDSQGIKDNAPFSFSVEARHAGSC